MRSERRRQDDVAQDARRPRGARRRRGGEAVGPDDRLPAAGRPQPQRPDAHRRSGARVQAPPRHAGRDPIARGAARRRLGERGRALGDAEPVQRAAGDLPAARGLHHRSQDHDRPARARVHTRRHGSA